MNTLLVLYSRTGTTRAVGQRIARACGASIYEIKDARSRTGVLGYARSIIDAVRGREAPIEPPTVDASAYDLVVLGAPVWAGHVAAPMRTFLAQYKERLQRTASFCTMASSGADGALREMAEAADQMPLARLVLTQKEVETGAGNEKIDRFIDALRALDVGARRAAPSRPEAARPHPQVIHGATRGGRVGGPNPRTQRGGDAR